MSERNSRKRNIPAHRRATSSTRARRPSPSAAPHRKTRPVAESKFWRPSENVKFLKRSKSEPSLLKPSGGEADVPTEVEDDDGVLYRPRTCTDIFSSLENLVPEIPGKCSEGYNKDAKVVVNVTVEGSPGPIRTMIKLGSNIEETIKAVINKYNEEGRTPRLDKDVASSSQLHHSYFSLESLSKSDLIGEVGTRSFYLRKNNSGRSNDSRSEITSGSSNKDLTRVTSSNQLTSSTHFFQIVIQRNLKKIFRKTRKILRFFGCITCTV